MKKPAWLRPAATLVFCALVLAGCGGGGGGGDGGGSFPSFQPGPSAPPPPEPETPPSTRFGASTQLENQCTLEGQKRWLRAYMDEVYLWYNEIPDVNPALYGNIPDYFEALLVKTPDANGLPRDRFSAVLPASQALDLKAPPLSLDPALLAAHTDAVPVSRVVTTTGGRRVAYVQFNDHETGAQDDLIDAFRVLRDTGNVQDLVLDLRFNSGGYLYIAQTAASMVVGPGAEGAVFERLQYNDKRTAETAQSTLTFSSRLQFSESSRYPVGTALPQLGLQRVFVLTSGRTCSASESIINALGGIDVQVVMVGNTTCGKPYGFRQKNNCGLAFFPIEFLGTNAKGFGSYTSGFPPTCPVQDNTAVAAGSAEDPLLKAALTYVDTGACPAPTPGPAQASGTPRVSSEQPSRPSWAGRILLPQQQMPR